ncbi:hypothetical protein AB0890_08415 [Streptomyces sp. NPDC005406]|uniref:hypothetical protein n=1 Tax=Streptomyces sp. NPDC005406 TaxID=3155339 RepID=UPI0034520531
MPVQRLSMPVVPETGAPATGPAPEPGAPSGVPQPLTVRASHPAPARLGGDRQGGGPGSPTPRIPAPATRDQALQRAVEAAGLSGVPVRVVQPKSAKSGKSARSGQPARSASAPVPTAADAAGAPRANEVNGLDIEELARRLLDPVSRLIRADLRRGRERSGRPYDGRR